MIPSIFPLTSLVAAAYSTRGVRGGVFMLGYLSQRTEAPAQTTVPLDSTALHSMYASLVLQHLMFSYEGSVPKQKKAKGSSGSQAQNPQITHGYL